MLTGLCLVFYPVQNLHFLTSPKSLAIEGKRPKATSFWLVLVHFRIVYCANFLHIGQQSGVTWKGMIEISEFECDSVTGDCLNLIFFLTNFWLTVGVVFLKARITSPIMVSNVFQHPWSQLTSQDVLRSCASPLWLVSRQFLNNILNFCGSYYDFFNLLIVRRKISGVCLAYW